MEWKAQFQGIEGRPPLVLAPMAGVTDFAFREVCCREGADLAYSEMVSAKGLKYNSQRTFEVADVHAGEAIVIQLFGRDPEDIALAVRVLQDRQGDCIRGFDLNMGCPAPKIVRNGEGSALMREPALAASLVEAAKKASHFPVSVKFRKGFDAGHPNYLSFAQPMEKAGADAVAIHGRFREQFYAGRADWDCIAEIKATLHIPVIANGDVFSPEDTKRLWQETGADAIMIGRGATGNPYLFHQIREYFRTGTYGAWPPEDRAACLMEQAKICCRAKGEHRAMQEFRKHAAWYLKGIRGAAALRQEALQLETLEDLARFTKRAFWDDAAAPNMV